MAEDLNKAIADAAAKADKAEVKIEAATGIKGSSGNWFSSHPGVIVGVIVALVAASVLLRSCFGW